MKRAIVKLKLKDFVVTGAIGSEVSVWGYKFVINQAKECVASMPEDQAQAAIDADRVTLIEYVDDDISDDIVEAKKIVSTPSDSKWESEFTDDIETFFGCKNLIDFRIGISKLNKWQMIDFGEKKLRITLAPTSSKSKMIADICAAVESLVGGAG